MATSSSKAAPADETTATDTRPATAGYRAVMKLANSFHAPDGLVVNGAHRDAVDGFVVAEAREIVEVNPDDVDVLHAVQIAVDLGRAVPA